MAFGLQLLNAGGAVVSDSTKLVTQVKGIFTVTSDTGGVVSYYDIPNSPAGHKAWCFAVPYSSFLIRGHVIPNNGADGRIEYQFFSSGGQSINVDIFYGWN